MNRTIVLLIFITCLGCKEITFESPQPKGKKPLNAMPRELQGKYLTIGEDGTMSKDTVIIDRNGYRFGYYDIADRAHENDAYEKGVLSDSLVLKSYKGHYFISLKENNQWLLRVLKPERNGRLLYMAMEKKDTDFKEYVNRLATEIRIDSFPDRDQMVYRIDPSPNQLIDLINKGFFSSSLLVKIKE